jgi:hypothetical protein
MREFETGATRDSDKEKLDYEGFLGPLALRCYAEYLHKHRMQADGKMRDSDNWQKGIPFDVYMKSLWRHLIELWTEHRSLTPGYDLALLDAASYEILSDSLCAIIFNAFGYLHELEKGLQS